MIKSVLTAALVLTLTGAAHAQDKPEAAAAGDDPAATTIDVFGQKKQVTVKLKEAMDKGDAAAVLAAGGTPTDAFEAMRAKGVGGLAKAETADFIAAFADTSTGGSIEAGQAEGQPALTRTWPNGVRMAISLDGKDISLTSPVGIPMGPNNTPDFAALPNIPARAPAPR